MCALQVCQHVVDARKGEDGVVPAPLMARMIKYRILKRRMQDMASRESSAVKVSRESLRSRVTVYLCTKYIA